MSNPRAAIIDLRSIATPLEQCVFLEIGTVDPARVAELRDRDFDQAPVVGPGRTFVGVIETAAATQLAQDAVSLDPESPAVERSRVIARFTASFVFQLSAVVGSVRRYAHRHSRR